MEDRCRFSHTEVHELLLGQPLGLELAELRGVPSVGSRLMIQKLRRNEPLEETHESISSFTSSRRSVAMAPLIKVSI